MIIPVRDITTELRETLFKLRELVPPAGDILVLPDDVPRESFPGVQFVATGAQGPATKRDLALPHARGEILAFLDDDAYPASDWLAKAVPHFTDPRVAAVGGPAVTPPGERFWAAAAGAVLSSWLGSGPTRMRFLSAGSVRTVDDWPTVNLLVRRDVFAAIGGFGSSFWPGEDTKLCLEIVQRGYRILYDPTAIVYHHRATTPLKHLRQFARYGLHRGHFFRKYPSTSRRISYGLPSVVTLAGGAALVLFALLPAARPPLTALGALLLLLLLGAGVSEAGRAQRPLLALAVPFLLLATHLTYAVAFLRGLAAPSLKRYARASR